MAKIATVYHPRRGPDTLEDMSFIRWRAMSAALAAMGHRVDIVRGTTEGEAPVLRDVGQNLREIPLSSARWDEYDAVKTLFHLGWETLEAHGGEDHPLIVAKLGSVVADEDRPGIYFFGEKRARLYETQKRIHERARYVTLLSPPARELWTECLGPRDGMLLVPGAAPRDVPAPGPDPFPRDGARRCLFAGNIYNEHSQPEANRVLVDKLNGLGRRLRGTGVRLHLLGIGDVSRLDPACVTHLGAVPFPESWRFLQHADVGIVLAPGPFLHNNESTKIYHYLRVGLPVVSERGFPNDHVLETARHGFVVENANLDAMAERVVEAAGRSWDGERAARIIRECHTWERRAAVYDELLRDLEAP